jgi:hypothetical protein
MLTLIGFLLLFRAFLNKLFQSGLCPWCKSQDLPGLLRLLVLQTRNAPYYLKVLGPDHPPPTLGKFSEKKALRLGLLIFPHFPTKLGVVTHTCNTSYSGGGNRRITCFGKGNKDLHQKKGLGK